MKHEYMTTTEVAHYLRTPTATLRYWRHKGYGPKGIRVGRRVLYDLAEVEAWLAQVANDNMRRS
jgi:excisionase family DNA binding protein